MISATKIAWTVPEIQRWLRHHLGTAFIISVRVLDDLFNGWDENAKAKI